MAKLHLFAHMDKNLVKKGDVVKAYETPIGTIGDGNGQYYAHLHFSISEGLTVDQLLKYVKGWTKNKVSESYKDPRDIDFEKMFGRKMDVGNFGYDYLQRIPNYGYHPGVDVNGLGGGNTDFGYVFKSSCSGIVVYEKRTWFKNGGWGNVIIIEERGVEIPPEYPYRGIDVSHWQGNKSGKKIDWSKVPPQDFIVLKATQGTKHIDTNFTGWQRDIRERGDKLGYYHFADGGNATEEAKHFYKTTGSLKKGEFMVLDWEHITYPNAVEWCLEFLGYIYQKTGVLPMIYMGNREVKKFDWKPVAEKYPLWIARYGKNNGNINHSQPPSTGAWDDWTIWQYTSKGFVPGIDTDVDKNVAKNLPEGYNGDECTHSCPKHC